MKINSYITFSGDCREAMTFYQSCLGGELTFQTIGQSPLADKMPAQMKAFILHAELKKDDLVLLASDMVGKDGLLKGNSVSLMLECGSKKELESSYKKLSSGGKKDHPIEETFFGDYLGNLTDKFGNHWLLHSTGKP